MLGSTFGNLLIAIADVLDWVFRALQIVIFLRALLSWVNADPYNGIVRAIYAISEPFLAPFRKILPPWRLNGLDLSPVLAFLALLFAQKFIVVTLYDIGSKLK